MMDWIYLSATGSLRFGKEEIIQWFFATIVVVDSN
jgi:hypothetical protein